MQKEDKSLLIMLGTLGALVLAGGVGMAAFMVRKTGRGAGSGFVVGCAVTAMSLYMATTMDPQ